MYTEQSHNILSEVSKENMAQLCNPTAGRSEKVPGSPFSKVPGNPKRCCWEYLCSPRIPKV